MKHSFQFVRFVIIAFLLFFCAATLSGSACNRKTSDPATGEPSRNPTAADNYYDPATAGPGYPNQGVITVFLVQTGDFPTRWEVCRDAVELYRPILSECGKEIKYVGSPVGANIVLPRWTDVRSGSDAWTAGIGSVDIGTIYIDYSVYNKDDTYLFQTAAHEVGHGLGLGHSPDERDMMYKDSLVSKLSARDKNTIRLTLKP